MTINHDGFVELFLAKLKAKDSGIYMCIAVNEAGTAEASAKVDILEDTINKPTEEEAKHIP